MKVLIVDISGKVLNYDIALCNAIHKENAADIIFTAPSSMISYFSFKTLKLLNLVPAKYKNTEAFWKKIVKALEGVINYLILIIYVFVNRKDVIHLQWLPFLEVFGIERYFLRMIKFVSPSSHLILTIHNVYPHNFSQLSKEKYRRRFQRVTRYVDSFIVHTNNTKENVAREFGLEGCDIEVVHHGIFSTNDYVPLKWRGAPDGKWNLIMYGNQSYYKGTDVLVESLNYLPKEIKDDIKLTICGDIQKTYYEQLKGIETGVEIKWIPSFVESKELYSMIDRSDIILLPYREISQSGVLLLALYFKRPIIASDLPSFRETLFGFTNEMFCNAGDAQSLAQTITNYVNGKVDINKQLEMIDNLNLKYSWEESARKTLNVYKKYYVS